MGALALLIVAATITPITDYDIFFHLRRGATILETGRIPQVDDFSALAPGEPVVVHEWLAEVVSRLAEESLGLQALVVLKCLLAIVLSALLYAAARTLGASPAIAVPGLGLVMLLAAARITERPYVFGYVLTAAFVLLLARSRGGATRGLAALVPLQILWVNLHGSFLFGPFLVGLCATAAAVEAVVERLWGRSQDASARARDALALVGLAGLLLLASLANPHGAELVRWILAYQKSGYVDVIYEWRPPFASAYAGSYMLRAYVLWAVCGYGVLAAAGFAAARRRQLPLMGIATGLVYASFLWLSLSQNRLVTDFALVTFPGVVALATTLLRPTPAWERRVCVIAAAVFLSAAAGFVAEGYPYRSSDRRTFGFGIGPRIPVAAADFVEQQGIRGAALTSYEVGGYLLYRLYPGVRISMCSYNEEGFDRYLEHERALGEPRALGDLLEKIRADFAFLQWPAPGRKTGALLRRSGRWALVYFDDRAVVYVRTDGPAASVAAREGFQFIDPASYQPGVLVAENADRVLAEARRAAERNGGTALTRIMEIEALGALGHREEAAKAEGELLARWPFSSRVERFLAVIHARWGDRAGALEHAERDRALRGY